MHDMTDKSRWALKRFKHIDALSHETHAFHAELTFDGKIWGWASNEGHGGSSGYYITGSPEVLPRIKLPEDFIGFIDDLVEDLIQDKAVKKGLKRLNKHLALGRYLFVIPEELKAWEAGTAHRESDAPPFHVCSLLSSVKQGSILFGSGDEAKLEAFTWEAERKERARHKAQVAEWLAAAQKEGDLRRAREAREEAKKAKKA